MGSTAALLLAGCSSGSSDDGAASASDSSAAQSPTGESTEGAFGTQYENTGTGPMVEPTIPEAPGVPNYFGEFRCEGDGADADVSKPAPKGCTRVFRLTAMPTVQQIARFPQKTATVWGYSAPGVPASSPGPSLISFADEQLQLTVDNQLPEATTIHPHGLHQPNESDGVAGVSQPSPVPAGETYEYAPFVPGHVGTFAYHSHFDSAVQEMRGLDGFFVVLPREEHESVKADVDVMMTLQIWFWEGEGALVQPFGKMPGNGFPFDTINGKTGDASGGPINIKEGDRVRIRLYNASQQTHSMHLHGHDEVVVSQAGHANPPVRETTQSVNPGEFYELEFDANNPGNWVFHCHFPHHTANGMMSGPNGAPVGMTRIFHYENALPVPADYFTAPGFKSETVG